MVTAGARNTIKNTSGGANISARAIDMAAEAAAH